ncbi:PREDICTED: uncharacterized protein LOC108380516 [Rhagoletis zephyria]|uniref:uncharacterized protein LOC108380516 n=1 Tax=Rhagoletis zephyria TaxID=28612 RepID=UPI000811767E|nr:PREDICTED: uncharacterized protein LOC108380516 [Rhagoletis zephyria]XP_017492491.1 PREDICTED: uncharacterized protein LOC108380516 [Rhagoletis zephyria]XP_017492556.1 PREDICTED: uncharacterized protein LOC108380516 [Rhagoletis zephyria]XP_017492625.1 PREDICTED: uncharacterized protein LOC108380516 [Rhagoletis zephyria]XP_017492695.1 PREDICTED: uncharacterized protein LOC108380516 [Rhagoletis zephyria]XP_017492760.1 PREDICTED: uncharacterized protein LOC108380516 [Rhagoletis zephyria]XP_01
MNNEISGKTLLSVTASIAAAIIPDTPIVSIAGATLSEITTTTTSTTTTPTPISFIPSTKLNKDHSIANLPNNPMSDAAVTKSAGGNGNTTANATATNITRANDALADPGGIAGKNATTEHPIIVNAAHVGKTDEATTNTTIDTKKSDVSDLEEPDLKKLLEEAYTYKTPKDKKDKSEIFLDLLQKVENEDLGITSTRSDSHRHHPHSQNRHQQKQGGSLQDLLQLPPDYRRQNHTSRHKKNSSVSSRQREGGSLPSNVNVANCLLSSFEQQASVYADKRVRRAILLGVETATVALNSNNTLVGVVGGPSGGNNATGGLSTNSSGSGSTNSTSLCNKEGGNSIGASVTSVSGGSGNMATTASGHSVGSTMATGAGIGNTGLKNTNPKSGSGDYIINIGDMIDIQQQQQILPSKAQDGGQGLPYYERVDIDMRIPRPNLVRDGGDFAPTRSHHYVDEVIRFHQIDSGEGGLCESGEVAISVNALGSTLKSAAASCSLPMPLDERYRSIKSVMGEKGEGAGASVNSVSTAKSSTSMVPNSGSSGNNSNNSVSSGGGSNSIGIGSYSKSLPLSRQTDENGNDCERQQHSSSIVVSAGQSQAKAKAKKKPQKDNTIPVDVENEAGYRGKDPVEVLVKFIESTEEDSKQSGSGGGSGNSKFGENTKKKERRKEKVKQNKMKKSNSLEELRSCAKIDVGELKRSAATTESNNVTMRSKGSGGGKGTKNNSGSTADINKNFDGGSKEVAATAAVSCSKQVPIAATTTGATPANNRKGERRSWGTEELQYLGIEGNVGNAGGNGASINIEEKVKEKKDKKSKDKEKEKDKDRDIEKEKGRDKEKEKDKDGDRHEKPTNNRLDSNAKLERHDRNEKIEKIEKQEKLEKPDKLEKRKKSESLVQLSTTPTKTATNLERQNSQPANTPDFSPIDLLSMNTLISETAEFHVVTKKKKPKKQRASIDETHCTQGSNYHNNTSHNSYNYNNNNSNNTTGTTGSFARAHNLVINAQKGSNNSNSASSFGNQQQLQQQSRYKYYNNNAHGFNTYGNNNNSGGGDGARLDYHNNYNSNYNNNYNLNNSSNNNHSYQQYGGYQQQSQYHYHHHHQQQQHQQHQQHQQQQQQQQQHQQQQQQQHVTPNTMSGSATDKSRRKSTSSVPPSEKSDSSDLDSVHSLPIESTAASASKNKQRLKPASSAAATPETPKSATSLGSPAPAPISYAHIAAAAAVDRWPSLDAANNNNSSATGNGSLSVATSTVEQSQQHAANVDATPAPLTNANNAAATAAVVASTAASSATKPGKSKKLASKPDFPELVATNATATDIGKASANPSSAAVASKTISYSQSLVAAPAQQSSSSVGNALVEKTAGAIVEAASGSGNIKASNTVPDVNKVDNNSVSTTRIPQHQATQHQQQLQQQTLHKSKSVEHDSYSFNSSNLDQQYPALEKTVKRHSATNVSMSPPTAAGSVSGGGSASSSTAALAATSMLPTNATSVGKFNFAAAAKQLASKGGIAPQPVPMSPSIATEPPSAEPASQTTNVAATTTSNTNYSMATAASPLAASSSNVAPLAAATRKAKEKSPTSVFVPATINIGVGAQPTTINAPDAAATNIVRKNKKDKAQPLLSAEVAGEPLGHVAQKSSTATQTQSTSMDVVVMPSKTIARSQPAFVVGSEVVMTTPALSKTQRQHASSVGGSNKTNAVSRGTATISATAGGATTGGGSASNRPAVIILNDDRSGDSSATGIEFTFGDFNEDELKFFDESVTEEECADGFTGDELPQAASEGKVATKTASTATSTNTAACFNDSGIASDISNANNMSAFAESSTMFAGVSMAEHSNPQPPNTAAGTESGNKLRVRAVESEGDKVNTLPGVQDTDESNETISQASVPATLDCEQLQQSSQRRNSETPQLQQLETCNEIETAILAAARAAAEQQHQQPMQPPPAQQQRSFRQKHQQQQYRSTSYGNANIGYEPTHPREQRSQSSAYARDAPNHYQPQQQPHYHTSYQQQQQQQHYHYHQSGSSNSASRSRSSSSNNNTNSYDASGHTPPPQSPNTSPSVVVNIQRKEFDIHFIPPTMSNAYSSLQHNEIIVDFIGSAWEEVAKVTKFYEGQ